MPRAARVSKVARVLLVLYGLAGLAVLLQPSASIATRTILDFSEFLTTFDLPLEVTHPRRVEHLLNAAMFVPAALLAMLSFSRIRWAELTVAGFCGSLLVEVLQALLLSARNGEPADVVTNTTGAPVGAVLGALLRTRVACGSDHS